MAAKQSPYHFNQFGGDVGGPVLVKSFFSSRLCGQRNTLPNLVFLACPLPPLRRQSAGSPHYCSRVPAPGCRTQTRTLSRKADWRLGNNELLEFATFSRFIGNGFENGGSQNSIEHTGASDVTTDTLSGSLTSTISSGMVNVARAAYARDNEPGLANKHQSRGHVRQAASPISLSAGISSASLHQHSPRAKSAITSPSLMVATPSRRHEYSRR